MSGTKPQVHHSDDGSADAIRRPLVPPGTGRTRPSSGQAAWAALLSPLSWGSEALPHGPDELLTSVDTGDRGSPDSKSDDNAGAKCSARECRQDQTMTHPPTVRKPDP